MSDHPGCPEHYGARKPACPVCMGLAVVERRPEPACIYCGQGHDHGTPCPSLEFPGTEWDQ